MARSKNGKTLTFQEQLFSTFKTRNPWKYTSIHSYSEQIPLNSTRVTPRKVDLGLQGRLSAASELVQQRILPDLHQEGPFNPGSINRLSLKQTNWTDGSLHSSESTELSFVYWSAIYTSQKKAVQHLRPFRFSVLRDSSAGWALRGGEGGVCVSEHAFKSLPGHGGTFFFFCPLQQSSAQPDQKSSWIRKRPLVCAVLTI